MSTSDIKSPRVQRVLRFPEVSEATGLKRTQIEVLVARKEFPKPIRVSSRRIAWLESEVADWQAKRIAKRDAEPPAAPPKRAAKKGKKGRSLTKSD
jgi:prophage regulatory protein